MIKKMKTYIDKYHMIQDGDRLIVGVSGGVDSVCLLFALLELRGIYQYDIIVVHVNHELRGKSADEDEAFVEMLCREHKLEFVGYHVDIRNLAQVKKQSLEEAGRNARRHAFEKTFEEKRGTKIVMAHHKNDNAETLLMNLSRGTGLRGMGGMRPVCGKVIRPFLCVERKEIEAFADRHLIAYRMDESNASDDYTRNRIRNHVLPFFEEHVNARAVEHMNEAMLQMRELQQYINRQVENAYASGVTINRDKEMLINGDEFDRLDEILKGPLIIKCISKMAAKEQDIAKAHVKAVSSLFKKQVGRKLDLPYNIEAARDYEGVTLRRNMAEKKENLSPVKIQIPGTTKIPGADMTITCTIIGKSDEFSVNSIPQKTYTKWFDYDIMKNDLVIRTRLPGDCITIDRNGNTQKLKSYLINEKVPAAIRDTLPLITENQQVVWIPGYRMSSFYQINEYTKSVLQIQINGGKADVRDN